MSKKLSKLSLGKKEISSFEAEQIQGGTFYGACETEVLQCPKPKTYTSCGEGTAIQ